jgi:hypothetical protein
MRRLLVNIVLFFTAVLLLSTVGVVGLMYAAIDSVIGNTIKSIIKYWSDLIYQINVGIDQIGNVLLASFLNDFSLIDSELYPFGKVDMTISHVLAVNQKNNNVKGFGLWLIGVLEWLDPGHMERSL